MLSVMWFGMPCCKTTVDVRRNSIVILIWITLVMSFTLIFSMISQLILMSQWVIPCRIRCFVCSHCRGCCWARGSWQGLLSWSCCTGYRGMFASLVVESLGFWFPTSLVVLRDSWVYGHQKHEVQHHRNISQIQKTQTPVQTRLGLKVQKEWLATKHTVRNTLNPSLIT